MTNRDAIKLLSRHYKSNPLWEAVDRANEALEEASRWYLSDGTFETIDRETVKERRISAAQTLKHQREELTQLRKSHAEAVDRVAALETLVNQQNQKLRRWYKADGTYQTSKRPDQVMEDRKAAAIHLDQLLVESHDLKDSLKRILAWARDNTTNVESLAGDFDISVSGDGEDLFTALGDSGYELDHDGVMVIAGERVEGRLI